MVPARAVGGDFYTFFALPGGKLGVVVGDVSDKGVPAALFMALSYSLIRAEAVRTKSPTRALRTANGHLLQMNSSGMYVTLLYGILDCSNGDFLFARAAHPLPFRMDKKGKASKMAVTLSQPLGLFDSPIIDEQKINLLPGDTLLLYSDGITETMDPAGVEFGVESIHRTLAASRDRSAAQVCTQLWEQVKSHGENLAQQDDFTAVVVKRNETG
jgi:phosphoserine phosphatase RsbU/P